MGDSIAAQAIGSGGRREVRQRAEGARRADLLLGCAQAEADHTKPSPPTSRQFQPWGAAAAQRAAASRPARMGPGHARDLTSVRRGSGKLAVMRARALAFLLYPVAGVGLASIFGWHL